MLAIASLGALLAGCLSGTDSLTGGTAGNVAPAAVPPNDPPTINGVPGTTRVVVGESFWFRPIAADPDGDPLTFSIANRPSWLQFDTATGTLSGTATAADVGAYPSISISVSDGHTTVSGPVFALAVRPAAGSLGPTIGGTPATTAAVGRAYSFQAMATDPKGLTLTFSIANQPAWASFNPATGALTGTPAATDLGNFANIAISVSNGTLSASLPVFMITVQSATLGSATVSWQPPMQRTDGTPLTNLAGFRIYYGAASGNYANKITVANPGLTMYVVDNLPSGTYYFVATAYDTAGNESAYSGPPASKTIM